jgi:hypothetical protein
VAKETAAERRQRERREQRRVARTRAQVELDYAWVMALIESDTTGSWGNIFDWVVGKIEENRRRPVPQQLAFTEAELQREINKTEWKQSRDSLVAQAEIDRQRFPRDFERSVDDRRKDIAELAQQQGIRISDEDLNDLALRARLSGWDRDQTRRSLEPFLTSTLAGEGDLTGVAGDFETQLLNWSRQNGLRLSRDTAAKYIESMTLGRQTLRDVQDELRRTYLAGMYPAWSDKINQGFDPSVLFDPYREAAANLLEMSDIGLDDPIMKRAAQYVGADGKPAQLPLYQFEEEVRKDPRWQYTDNAHQSYARVGTDLLRMFGLR